MRPRSPKQPACRRIGFTLVEVLITLAILAVAIVPMVAAFAPSRQAPAAQEQHTVFVNRARATLTRVLAQDYSSLLAHVTNSVDLAALFGSLPEAARERFLLDGKTHTPIVAIADASGGTGGLLRITVTVSGTTLETRKANR